MVTFLWGCAPIVPAPTIERIIVPIDRDSQRVYHYLVKSGDTLYAISRLHGLSVDQIAQMNDIAEPYVIHPDQLLVVDYKMISREVSVTGDGTQTQPQKPVALADQNDSTSRNANTLKTESRGVKVIRMPRPPTSSQVTSLNTSQSVKTAEETKNSEQKKSSDSVRSQSNIASSNESAKPQDRAVVVGPSTTHTKTITEPQRESPLPSKQEPKEVATSEAPKERGGSSAASKSADGANMSFVARTEPISTLPKSSPKQSVESLPKGWTRPVSASPTNSFGKDDGLHYFLNQGNQVVAAASGRVTYAGVALSNDFKYMVLIKTPDDYVIQYDFNTDLSVQENELVSKGQDLVKIVNNTSSQQATSSDEYRKVFFAIRKKGVPQDPDKLIGKPKAEEI